MLSVVGLVVAVVSMILLDVPPAAASQYAVSLGCDAASAAYCTAADPLTLGSGATIDVSGSGFAANAALVSWLDTNGNGQLDVNEPSKEMKADGAGAFGPAPLLADDIPAGTYLLQVGACPALAPGATDPCAVTVLPSATPITGSVSAPVTINLSASPSKMGATSDVTVTGYGLPAASPVNVWVDANNNSSLDAGETSVVANTSLTGSFSITLPAVKAPPGTAYIRAGTGPVPGTAAQATSSVDIGTCWFQDCIINGRDTICLVGNSPADFLSDCKAVDSNYTNSPTGLDLNNVGPTFVGAGALAAAANDFSIPPPLPAAGAQDPPYLPTTGCFAVEAAISTAQTVYGNTVPDAGFDYTKQTSDLTDIACGNPPPLPPPPVPLPSPPYTLETYVLAEGAQGHTIPDIGVVEGLVAAGQAVAAAVEGAVVTACAAAGATLATVLTALGPVLAALDPATLSVILGAVAALGAAICGLAPAAVLTAVMAAFQGLFAMAAVAGAVACGHVDYYCNGSDITKTILGSAALQQEAIPIPFLQPYHGANPNPCRPAVGSQLGTTRCWGDVIGWSQVLCTSPPPDGTTCEQPAADGTYPQLPVPGSSGDNNQAAPRKCATGIVQGLSIGYDGDAGFDMMAPSIVGLVNYHNFLPGPGGTPPPNGIDIEIPLGDPSHPMPTDRANFLPQLQQLRPGMMVNVCGQWVSDMHMYWNELHPIDTLTILSDDLGITASGPAGAVTAGTDSQYSFTVTNAGPANEPDAKAAVTLPPGTSFAGSTANCTPTGLSVTCDLGPLAAGGLTTFSMRVAVGADYVAASGGFGSFTITATARGTYTDVNPANDAATVTTMVNEQADLAVSKMCTPDTTVSAGTPINCTVFVDNAGPSFARSVTIDDTSLSNGNFIVSNAVPSTGSCDPLSAVPNGQDLTCHLGVLANASTTTTGRATLSYTMIGTSTSAAGQNITNTATVRSDTPDPNDANNTATMNLTVTAVGDLALAMTGPSPPSVVAGTPISWTLTATNNGPSDAAGTVITDTVPSGVTITSVSISGAGSCTTGVAGDPTQPATCSVGTLPAGAAPPTMTVNAIVNPNKTGSLHNNARISSTTFDSNTANDLASTTTAVLTSSDLATAIAATPNVATAGSPLSYQITVNNQGPSTATGNTLSDVLPPSLVFSSTGGTGACGLQTVTNTVTCTLAPLDPGQSAVVFIYATVKASTPPGTAVIVDSATATSATGPNPAPADNTATISTGVQTQADLGLVLTSDATSYKPSTTIHYTVTVTDSGPSDAQVPTVVLTAPGTKVVQVTSISISGCTVTATTLNTTVTCKLGTIASGGTTGYQVNMLIRGNKGTISATASASSPTTDTNLANNSQTRTVSLT